MICAHCEAEFLPTKRQARRAAAAGRDHRSYCSDICLRAGRGLLLRKDTPEYGPCPICGKRFRSRYPKLFCGMKCYTSSAAFKQRVREQSAKATAASVLKRTGEPYAGPEEIICLECQKTFFAKPSRKSRFCSRAHYRTYFAKRFDRWIASPQEIALPQAYDEFLSSDDLPCLVSGCAWAGQSLSAHMNFAHGVPAREFKRAAGFNLRTGVIGAALQQQLSERPHLLGAWGWLEPFSAANLAKGRQGGNVAHYLSREAREHGAKGRALSLATEPPPERICKSCGKSFGQSTVFGFTKYCSVECRSRFYRVDSGHQRVFRCGECRRPFRGSADQRRRSQKGRPVFCSFNCRQKANGRKNPTTGHLTLGG